MKFRLPGINIATSYIFNDRTERLLAVLDTLVIEPDEGLFTMVWRCGMGGLKNPENLRQVNIYEKAD
ncbi:MAG: DUF2169 domain-containing protein [Desulfobacterales bacterium]